jgi:hypothetical protein
MAGATKKREGTGLPSQDRPGVHENVAIGIIDGESDERLPRSVPRLEARRRLFKRQDLIAPGAYVADHGIEIGGRDLEAAVGREPRLQSSARTDVVERKNGPDAPKQRRKRARCATIEHGVKTAAKQFGFHHRSGLIAPGRRLLPASYTNRGDSQATEAAQESRVSSLDGRMCGFFASLVNANASLNREGKKLVGAAGFEPATPIPPE